MSATASTIQLVGEVSDQTREDLRNTVLESYSTFDFYRGTFDQLGIRRQVILQQDPLRLLQRLPLLEGDDLHQLSDESLEVGERIIDMETSSGTTGPRKRRFISAGDDVSETEFLAELFGVCGIGPGDRVACLDTDPLTLMVSFTRALDLLGVEEAYTLCVGSDFSATLESLPKLDPTVVVAIPSILDRCIGPLQDSYRRATSPSLTKVVCAGERLSDATRRCLESEFGVQVFGYYGASETSALGIECQAHDGIHLWTDRNIIEVVVADAAQRTGEVVVTTLRQQTMPLLRYALRDMIVVKSGQCPCGLSYPRAEVKGRAGEGFSVLGAKLSYTPLLNAIYPGEAKPGNMQILLTREDRDKLTLVLPELMRSRQSEIKETLLRSQPDLDFLVRSGFLGLDFSFMAEAHFEGSRKPRSVVDLRGEQP